MNIKEFFSRFFSLIIHFPYEWRKIINEQKQPHYIFLTYSSVLSLITFFLGGLWYTGLKVGVDFILIKSVKFAIANFLYVGILSIIFGEISNYYHWGFNDKKTSQGLVIYSSVFYLVAIYIGTLLSPENYFFILFILSFFSAYYFARILEKKITKQYVAYLTGLLLYIFHLASYFTYFSILAT